MTARAALPKGAFVALAAVAWADGTLDPNEADAIIRAAADEGLALEELEAVERRSARTRVARATR